MRHEPVTPPSVEELQAFGLGVCTPWRAEEIESFLAEGPDCGPILGAAPDDTVVGHLRGAGHLLPAFTVAADVPAEAEIGPEAAALRECPRYRLIRKLGEGGMGAVYLAEHRLMGRLVAIKLIRAEYLDSPRLIERFRREVRAAAGLAHPNVVAAYDADEVAGTHFLVMEYLEGETLAARLARFGPLPVAEACDYVRQAALGLEYARTRGTVHRDVKPHNLMRTADGTVKVLDFGLARVRDGNEADACGRASDGAGTAFCLSTAGTVMGTSGYMAPEQARDSRAADTRADVYALGRTLSHLLTGRAPGAGPQPLTGTPARLRQVIARMTAARPEDRY
jgi:serine/threonine protein kinase